MKNILITFLILLVVFGCKKETAEIEGQEPGVVFKILEIDPENNIKSSASWECPTDDDGYLLESAFAEIVIDGETYTPEVFRVNGKLYTQAIKFDVQPNETKTCNVTQFLLKAADGTLVMAGPEKDAEFSEYVSKAIPFTFIVEGFTKVETDVDVICFLPEYYLRYGFEWYSVSEIVIREKCFFGDICVNPADYENSDYENQSTGLQVDMPAIAEIVVKKDGVEVENSPFTNASDDMGWGVGQPLCVQYPDDINVDGEEFTFELFILVHDGQGGFEYELKHTFTATDDGPLDVIDNGNDGVIDFVLGNCVFNDPNNITIDLELDWPLNCETAFAYNENSSICFLDLSEINTNRWGWTSGMFYENESAYQFDLYAGAAQCDITKGTLVGSVTLEYMDNNATVNYEMVGGYFLEEVHIYVGNEILPRDHKDRFTVSPGQFPHVNENLNGATTYSYTFTNLTGGVFVIAHAVACSSYP